MPAILHVTPARYPQAQYALALPRRTWHAVEVRRHDHGTLLVVTQSGTLGTLPAPAWLLTARYSRRRQAMAHAHLIAKQYPATYEVRIRKQVSP